MSWLALVETSFKPFVMNGAARSPFESHKKAYQGFVEWQQYMLEMRNSVQSRLESAKKKDEPYFLSFQRGRLALHCCGCIEFGVQIQIVLRKHHRVPRHFK